MFHGLDVPQFAYNSRAEGQLGHLQFLANMNNAVVIGIHVQVFVGM